MRVRTLLSILVALVIVFVVAVLTQQNIQLLQEPFRLGKSITVPLYVGLVVVFLLGFLPIVTILVVQTLKLELDRRRQRRNERQDRSRRSSFRRAVDFQTDGQLTKAAVELEAVMAEQPEDFGALMRYGEVLRRSGRVDEAIDVHRRASVLYPQSVSVLYQLIEDYEAAGDCEVAGQIRDRILREHPARGLRVLKRRRGRALSQQDWRTTQAIQEQIKGLGREGADVSSGDLDLDLERGLEYERGVVLLAEDKFQAAQAIFEAIEKSAPDFVPVRLMLGEIALLEGDRALAVDRWLRAWQSTGSPTFLQRIEDCYIEGEQPLQAIETLRQIIAEATDDVLPRFFLGQLYARLEMHEEALKVLAELEDRLLGAAYYNLLVGRLRERRGESSQALDAYRAAVGLAGMGGVGFSCQQCDRPWTAWQAHCDACGTWGAIELDLPVDPIRGDEVAFRERAVWPVNDEHD